MNLKQMEFVMHISRTIITTNLTPKNRFMEIHKIMKQLKKELEKQINIRNCNMQLAGSYRLI
jgi:hypothetical protein